MEKLLLTAREVAEMLGLGRTKTYELIAGGQIPSVRVGGCVRVPVEGLKEWLRERVSGTRADPQVTASPAAVRAD
jgi:prophage regulatory protein